MKVKDLKEHLKWYNDEDEIAWSIWTEDDVESVETWMEVELSEDERKDILDSVNTGFDASIGINWQVIESEINALIQNNGD